MKAIVIRNQGKNSQLEWTEFPMVKQDSEEVIVKIHATAVNRADLLQRRGLYPPPQGASDILGLECAGEIVERGLSASNFKVGDRVCALLSGGGYAEYVNIHQDMLLPIPENLSYEESAAFPESFYTAYLNLFELGRLEKREFCLIHSGASGVGVAAIQLAKISGAKVITTAGSSEKISKCLDLGADHAFNYKKERFAEKIRQLDNFEGIDLILDTVGAKFASDNIDILSYRGRMIIIGLLGGSASELDLGLVLRKNILIQGSTLRNRPLTEKVKLTRKMKSYIMPLLEKGSLKTIVDSVFPVQQVNEAHRRMSENKNFGKIVLTIT